mmetsp:Transcript_51514/g.101113  ORF Transcript_51514/g.101113 Transcript_51514/m.101113 type:complete len:194 (-) Transcript_51514:37-618(-)
MINRWIYKRHRKKSGDRVKLVKTSANAQRPPGACRSPACMMGKCKHGGKESQKQVVRRSPFQCPLQHEGSLALLLTPPKNLADLPEERTSPLTQAASVTPSSFLLSFLPSSSCPAFGSPTYLRVPPSQQIHPFSCQAYLSDLPFPSFFPPSRLKNNSSTSLRFLSLYLKNPTKISHQDLSTFKTLLSFLLPSV